MTCDVCRLAIEHYPTKRFFRYWPRPQHNMRAPKLHVPIFGNFALSGKFEGQYLRPATWQRQSGNGVGNYEGSPTSSKKFVNLIGTLQRLKRTLIFTHPPKILRFFFFIAGFAHAVQPTELNQTLPHGRG